LYCLGNATTITTADTPAKFKFVFTNQHGDTITSIASFNTQDELNAALPEFIDLLLEQTNYVIKQSGSDWLFTVVDNNNNELATSNNFSSQQVTQNSIDQFISELNNICDNEGLHLIEHILLRPRNNQFALAPVCLDPNCDFCGEQDPYSFRMTIVLPYWPVKFRNMAFRNYFEDLVRQESPAHTAVKVCWINDASLYIFETAYRDWITSLANYSLNASNAAVATDFQQKNDALLDLVFKLHSEYPVAALHDCEESKDTNPVMLGKTILGSFKT
jgi:hypothetical protein